ncbi:hypothetical protein FB009_12017 [Sinorhizobium medicae]|nr:hypothetical protein FB009_12017 [Sinorhizobium medicae]
MPCPALGQDNLCSIQEHKPVRCRAMPFMAFKDESSQSDLLVPKLGWKCDTGPNAPVVYRDRSIVERRDFDDERAALAEQTPGLQRYVDLLLKYDPVTATRLTKAAQSAQPGRVVVGFVSYLRHNRNLDIVSFARAQQPVLTEWAEKTNGSPQLASFNTFYRDAATDLDRYLSVK